MKVEGYIDALQDMMDKYRKDAYSLEADSLAWALFLAEKAVKQPVIKGTKGSIFCARCKVPLADRVTYCPHCGQRLMWRR